MNPLLPLVAVGVALANGANDNFKGVATLFGSGRTRYRGALLWATLTTFLGSAASIVVARGLASAFTGSGLLPDALVGQPAIALSAGAAAGATVALAAWRGLPISTTHALLGGLVGAGFAATSGGIHLDVLAGRFVAPLVSAPMLALAGTAVIHPALRPSPGAVPTDRHATAHHASRLLDLAHVASAGFVSFARGLNDTPKIAALFLAGSAFPGPAAAWITGLAMAAGGWWGARRVAETMSHRITPLTNRQGLTANLVTSVLVVSASGLGLPVSTTHVSVGSLIGVGVVTGGGRWKAIRDILTAWVATLPIAAILGALAYALTKGLDR